VRVQQRCDKVRNLVRPEADSKVLSEVDSRILTRRDTASKSATRVSFGLKKVGELAALSAQSQGDTMKAFEIGKGPG
jgi:hypothetical protein